MPPNASADPSAISQRTFYARAVRRAILVFVPVFGSGEKESGKVQTARRPVCRPAAADDARMTDADRSRLVDGPTGPPRSATALPCAVTCGAARRHPGISQRQALAAQPRTPFTGEEKRRRGPGVLFRWATCLPATSTTPAWQGSATASSLFGCSSANGVSLGGEERAGSIYSHSAPSFEGSEGIGRDAQQTE